MVKRSWNGANADWNTDADWLPVVAGGDGPIPGDTVSIASGTVILTSNGNASNHLFENNQVQLGGNAGATLLLENQSPTGRFFNVTIAGSATIEANGTRAFAGSITGTPNDGSTITLKADPGGNLVFLNGGAFNLTDRTIDFEGTVTLERSAKIAGDIVNNGTLAILSGTTTFATNSLSGTGTIEIGRNATFSVDGHEFSGASQTIEFEGTGGTLDLFFDSPGNFASTVRNFAPGDFIEFLGSSPVASASVDTNAHTLTITGTDGTNDVFTNFFGAAGALTSVHESSGRDLIGYASAAPRLNQQIDAGAEAMKADAVQAMTLPGSATPITGAGVKIGIISNSFNDDGTAAADVAAGYLPAAGVTVLTEGPAGQDDEGRAMAELIHASAPGAALYFASTGSGVDDFAASVQALQAAGCTVIVDDISLVGSEPFFQLGSPADNAIETAITDGVTYVSSAGNYGDAFYEHAFTSSAQTLFDGSTVQAMTFANGTPYQSITATGGLSDTIDLQWDAPFYGTGGVPSDQPDSIVFKAFDATTNALVGTSTQVSVDGHLVAESELTLPFAGTKTYNIAIYHADGTPVVSTIKYMLTGAGDGADVGGTINDPDAGVGSGTIQGHQLVPGAISVGAADVTDLSAFGPSAESEESFSSAGSASLFFDQDGNRYAQPVASGAPDVVGPDGIDTAVDGFAPFHGTSAAAPDVAAVVALMLQVNPLLTAADVASLLAQSAISLGLPAALQGAGLVQADKAVALAEAFVAQPTDSTPVAVADSYSIRDGATLTVTAPGVLANDSDADGDTLTAALVGLPKDGSLTLNPDGSFTYTPVAGFAGTDSFTYTASDGTKQTVPTTVTLTVLPADKPPAAVGDSYTVHGGTGSRLSVPAATGVLANDTDPDGDKLTATLASNAANGTVTLQPDGSFTYVPNAGYLGSDSFSYTASDGTLTTPAATVTLSVTDTAPVATADTYAANGHNPLAVTAANGVLANDTDADGDALTATLVGGPNKGSLTLNADGSFTYTPTTGFVGTDSFTYSASDGLRTSGVTTVTLDVSGNIERVSTTASGGQITYPVDQGDTIVNDLAGPVLSPDGTKIVFSSASQDLPGPAPSYEEGNGLGSATFEVVPASLYMKDLATGAVTNLSADPSGVNASLGESQGPVFSPDGTKVYFTAANAPDAIVEKDLTTGAVTEIPIGADQVLGAGTFFSSNANETNIAISPDGTKLAFLYSGATADSNGKTSTGVFVKDLTTGTLTEVAGGSYAPGDGIFFTSPSFSDDGTKLVFASTAPDLVAGDTNRREDIFVEDLTSQTFTRVSTSASGAQGDGDSVDPILSPDGRDVAFLSDAATLGPSNGNHDSELFLKDLTTGAVSDLSTAGSGDKPAFSADGSEIAYDDSPSGNGEIYVRNLITGSVRLVSSDAVGDTPSGSSRYPAFSPDGTAIAFMSYDNTLVPGDTNGQADIFVKNFLEVPVGSGQNTPPTAAPDLYSVASDTPLSVDAGTGVLANDTDAQGDAITAVLSQGPAHGTLDLSADGSFTYAPNEDFSGTDSFTYWASDGDWTSKRATVTLAVGSAPPQPPVANADSYATREGATLTVAVAAGVLANDTDPAGHPLSAVLAGKAAHGALTLNADGSFAYTPDAGYTGADSFTYLAADGALQSAATTVSLAVAAEHAPVAIADTYTVQEGSELKTGTVDGVLANDTDADGDALTATLVSNVAHGQLILGADGSLVYQPNADFVGMDSFTYTASDGTLSSGPATVTFTVSNANIFENTTGDGLWTTAANWSRGHVPVTGEEIGIPSDQMPRIADNQVGLLGAAVDNKGVIVVAATTNATDLRIDGTVTLTGGGHIDLAAGSRLFAITAGSTLDNVDNTVEGAGLLTGLSLVNEAHGVIDATPGAAGAALEISAAISGSGTMKIEDGASLRIDALAIGKVSIGAGTIAFSPDGATGSTLALGGTEVDAATDGAVITGFGTQDAIDLTGIGGLVFGGFDGTTLTLNRDGGGIETLAFAGLSAGRTFTTTSDGETGTLLRLGPGTAKVNVGLADDTGVSASDLVTRDPTITGTAAPGSLVALTIDGKSGPTTTADATGGWASTPPGLGDGSHTIVAQASDEAGVFGTPAALTFTLDTTAPAVTASAATPSVEATSTSGAAVSFIGAVSDLVDGTSDPIAYAEQLPDGTTRTVQSGSTFAIGTHTIVASATDAAGNIGSAAPFTFSVVDTSAPVVTASGPGAPVAATSAQGASVSFVGAVSDLVDGTSDPIAYTEQLPDRTTRSVQSGGTFAIGTHTIVASATDAAGNTGSAQPFSFSVVDASPPIVTAAGPAAPVAATSAQGASVSFVGSVSDLVDGTSDSITYTEQLSDGTTRIVHSGDMFGVGSHTILASATDSQGLTGSAAPFSFTVTTQAVLSGVAEDGDLAGATVFADASGNLAHDAGEATATTADDGTFTLVGASGPLVLTGGTDTATGLPFTGRLLAPAGSTVISPLTTLVEIVATTAGISATAADAAVVAALGLPAGTDLTHLDAQAGASAGDATATAVFAAQTTVADALSLITAAGGDVTSPAVGAALVAAVATPGALTGAAAFTALTKAAGLGDAASAAIARIALDAGALIESVAASGASAQAIVATIAAVAKVTQGAAAGRLAQAPADPTALAVVAADFSGDNLEEATRGAGGTVVPPQLTAPSLFGAVTHDATSAAGTVYGLYETILGRAPDPLGLENAVAALGGGTTPAALAQALLTSPEYTADSGGLASSSDSAFVTQLYQDGLHRSPEAAGLQGWTQALEGGGQSRAQVAAAIATSPEAQADLASTFQAGVFVPNATDAAIARLYYALLDRAPDASGLAAWEGAATSGGMALSDVTRAFLGSSEYQSTAVGQSNLQFVEGLYQTALGRAGDAPGLRDWTGALDSGTLSRADVVNGFLGSGEFAARTAGASTSQYIDQVYQVALGRTAEAGGQQSWQAAIASGLSRAGLDRAIVGSAEFQAKVTQPAQSAFVDALYEGALGRAPEADGLHGYQTALSGGVSLATVALDIAQSPEAETNLVHKIEAGFHVA